VKTQEPTRLRGLPRTEQIALAPTGNISQCLGIVLIDPLLSLAVSMHAQKGVYAILLGSGLSLRRLDLTTIEGAVG
jgi:hypothetical protein